MCSAKKAGEAGGEFARVAVAQGLAGHWLASGEQLFFLHYLFFLGLFLVFAY